MEGKGKSSLLEKLKSCGRSDVYPFHMPGHKRQVKMGITSFPNPFSVDITEISGFDNLHRPEGVLKESMEHAAEVYGSDRTYYLVNGSTCGILSALCAVTKTGSRIAMARNSHKAAYHAVLLNRLEPVYLWPELIVKKEIQGGIVPEDVETVLEEYGDAAAVFITSPTYEGIVSDVEGIAKIAHRHGIPLIVDEAHGAHFSFGGEAGGIFPKSALECGADVVVQSLHKTLPSLTQTAVLHIKSRLVKSEEIERCLQIFESSSPSYVLLSSIENCILYMEKEGRRRLAEYGGNLRRWLEDFEKLQNLSLLTDEIKGSCGAADRDISKLVVFTGDSDLTGTKLAELLRDRYHLESEMSCRRYVLLMTSLMDTEEGFARLKKALFEIDGMLKTEKKEAPLLWTGRPERCAGLHRAGELPLERIALLDGGGRISGDFITVYPPGIPAFTPGERLTDGGVKMIERHIDAGLTVEGVAGDRKIWVIKE